MSGMLVTSRQSYPVPASGAANDEIKRENSYNSDEEGPNNPLQAHVPPHGTPHSPVGKYMSIIPDPRINPPVVIDDLTNLVQVLVTELGQRTTINHEFIPDIAKDAADHFFEYHIEACGKGSRQFLVQVSSVPSSELPGDMIGVDHDSVILPDRRTLKTGTKSLPILLYIQVSPELAQGSPEPAQRRQNSGCCVVL